MIVSLNWSVSTGPYRNVFALRCLQKRYHGMSKGRGKGQLDYLAIFYQCRTIFRSVLWCTARWNHVLCMFVRPVCQKKLSLNDQHFWYNYDGKTECIKKVLQVELRVFLFSQLRLLYNVFFFGNLYHVNSYSPERRLTANACVDETLPSSLWKQHDFKTCQNLLHNLCRAFCIGLLTFLPIRRPFWILFQIAIMG